MKAKRETPNRRGGTRRFRPAERACGRSRLSRRTRPGRTSAPTRESPRAQVGTANQPHRPAGRAAGAAQEHESGQGPGQGAESQGAQGRSSSPERTFGRPAGVDRPAAPHIGEQGSVRRIGHRCARRRAGSHAVVVHGLRRALLPVEPRPREEPAAATAEGGAGTRCARGGIRTGAGGGGPQAGHDPDARHRAPGPGPVRELGGRRHAQAGRRGSAATAEHQASRTRPAAAPDAAGASRGGPGPVATRARGARAGQVRTRGAAARSRRRIDAGRPAPGADRTPAAGHAGRAGHRAGPRCAAPAGCPGAGAARAGRTRARSAARRGADPVGRLARFRRPRRCPRRYPRRCRFRCSRGRPPRFLNWLPPSSPPPRCSPAAAVAAARATVATPGAPQ